jgi:hypothetical protein
MKRHKQWYAISFDVFTQGKTLDDLVNNLKEAIHLHFEDDPDSVSGYAPNPSIFSTIDWKVVKKYFLLCFVCDCLRQKCQP